ncbi:putative phosphoribosyl transferasec [mine drainage metagenome]|uniref:Putative phosphoribosyl transferasec n=1 Tax=mine drainage metagenome TaxID=410659 RepID=A0A1J5R2E1_9ZZZZ
MESQFSDRRAAGRLLAEKLRTYRGRAGLLVFALPRGGVPVGYEVAKALGAELDVLIVRKLGVPNQSELAMGAISSGDALYLNEQIIKLAGITPSDVDHVLEQERNELARRERLYRGTKPMVEVDGRTVIVVDDGIATGASMRAALLALRGKNPKRLIIAVPVAPADAKERFQDVADEFVSVMNPIDFQAVGQFYEDFSATEDEEVRSLLAEAHKKAS